MRLKRIIAAFILVTFTTNLVLPSQAFAQAALNLPQPGTMVGLSPAFIPPMLRGITIHPENPLKFDFIVDMGDANLKDDELKKESETLVRYFLAALTLPENDLWVNLSPFEKDRIAPEKLSVTELGRDLLAQDYILKQLTASLIYPESELGKKFWDKIYKKAQEKYGTTEIPVNTFNKVWVVPSKAVVYEHNGTAFNVDSHLKVMLEEDYVALSSQSSAVSPLKAESRQLKASTADAAILREIIVPEIEKEVNTGKNFAQLRQIYNSVILAAWFKQNLKESLLGRVYADKAKVSGVDVTDKAVKEQIYQQYLEAYKKGAYNYIKEEYDQASEETIPRKYFSGGNVMNVIAAKALNVVRDPAMMSGSDRGQLSSAFTRAQAGRTRSVEVQMGEIGESALRSSDRAMLTAQLEKITSLLNKIPAAIKARQGNWGRYEFIPHHVFGHSDMEFKKGFLAITITTRNDAAIFAALRDPEVRQIIEQNGFWAGSVDTAHVDDDSDSSIDYVLPVLIPKDEGRESLVAQWEKLRKALTERRSVIDEIAKAPDRAMMTITGKISDASDDWNRKRERLRNLSHLDSTDPRVIEAQGDVKEVENAYYILIAEERRAREAAYGPKPDQDYAMMTGDSSEYSQAVRSVGNKKWQEALRLLGKNGIASLRPAPAPARPNVISFRGGSKRGEFLRQFDVEFGNYDIYTGEWVISLDKVDITGAQRNAYTNALRWKNGTLTYGNDETVTGSIRADDPLRTVQVDADRRIILSLDPSTLDRLNKALHTGSLSSSVTTRSLEDLTYHGPVKIVSSDRAMNGSYELTHGKTKADLEADRDTRQRIRDAAADHKRKTALYGSSFYTLPGERIVTDVDVTAFQAAFEKKWGWWPESKVTDRAMMANFNTLEEVAKVNRGDLSTLKALDLAGLNRLRVQLRQRTADSAAGLLAIPVANLDKVSRAVDAEIAFRGGDQAMLSGADADADASIRALALQFLERDGGSVDPQEIVDNIGIKRFDLPYVKATLKMWGGQERGQLFVFTNTTKLEAAYRSSGNRAMMAGSVEEWQAARDLMRSSDEGEIMWLARQAGADEFAARTFWNRIVRVQQSQSALFDSAGSLEEFMRKSGGELIGGFTPDYAKLQSELAKRAGERRDRAMMAGGYLEKTIAELLLIKGEFEAELDQLNAQPVSNDDVEGSVGARIARVVSEIEKIENIIRRKEAKPDSAMMADPVGGIDITNVNATLQIKRDGNGVALPINQQPLETINANFQGFVPLIINIKPMTNLPMLLGVAKPEAEKQLSSL